MAEYQVAKHKRGGWLSGLMALAIAACGETTTPDNGSETHFLLRCSESCGQGFECLGGVCTRDCEADVECGELDSAAVCDPGQGCRVFCDGDQDCTARNESWECEAGQCISTKPPIDAAECPLFAGGVQDATPRDTTYEEVTASENVAEAVADDTGLFWREDSGAVRGMVGSELIELRAATEETHSAMGIITDAENVYFADAGPPVQSPPEEPSAPPPPGTLYRVPKAGGPIEMLLSVQNKILTPLLATEQGVVSRMGDGLYWVVEKAPNRIEHVPAIPESHQLQIADGRVYWSDWVSVREPTELYAVDLEGGEPEVVTEIDGTFVVGHGRVLWKTETIVQDPLVQVEELHMLDLETGCITELPSLGESMGTPVLDARHVYWKSFNSLGNSGDEACVQPLPLARVNLTTGALEELQVSGFDTTLCTDFMAQDDDKLYIRTWPEQSLVAIDKP